MIDAGAAVTYRGDLDHGAFSRSRYPMALARDVGPGALIGVDLLGTRVITRKRTLCSESQGYGTTSSA